MSQFIGPLGRGARGLFYHHVQRALRVAIDRKILRLGDALPAERHMADFDVSRITVRKALDGLVDEGLYTQRQGTGTFLADLGEPA